MFLRHFLKYVLISFSQTLRNFLGDFFFMFGHLSLVTTAAQATCVAVPVPVPVPVHQNLYRFYCIFNLFQVT